jgi:hypothetical protein
VGGRPGKKNRGGYGDNAESKLSHIVSLCSLPVTGVPSSLQVRIGI